MEELRAWRGRIGAELDAVVAFWERHSHDPEYGGFFSCLSRDGSVYDDTKFVWLQGRQIWVYSRLYRTVPRFRRPELLEAARKAGEFLESHVRPEPGSTRAAFALSRDGRPVRLQRSFYSEAFCALGLDELGRAAGEERYRAWARRWAGAMWGWARGAPMELGRPRFSGTPPQQALAQAMMVLKVGLQLWGDPRRDPQNEPEAPEAEAMAEWGAQHVLMHLQRGDSVVLENVSPEGEELPGSLGRLMNPGHALEAAWLLLQLSGRRGDAALGARAVAALLEGPLRRGWDPQHGGLFSFLDADGLCPTQLEWSMKLWWPHAEAMVALLAAQRFQPRPSLVSQFLQVAQYTFDKFRDPEHGEWFGYLNRDGSVALSIKGGPYKGCFHVARALLMCEEMLDAILEGEEPPQ
ncbi:N-acylglucosamine 2-epimerase isoform X3 [Molothrus aeneus]|uniref:N-acylglucosamine 2-epimerase isoform X3 n=1 Tax=Molothrus aeneus TaxID=84833 RepID=UPI00345764FB